MFTGSGESHHAACRKRIQRMGRYFVNCLLALLAGVFSNQEFNT